MQINLLLSAIRRVHLLTNYIFQRKNLVIKCVLDIFCHRQNIYVDSPRYKQ